MKNDYEIRGDETAVFIWSKGVKYETLIHTTDLALVSTIDSWNIHGSHKRHKTLYARHKGVQFSVLMHRLIMNAPVDLAVDHINHNGLDNRRANLRLASYSENKQNGTEYTNNTSGVTGVSWDKDANKWKAQIRVNNKNITLGRFTSIVAAQKAREDAVPEYHPYADLTVDHYKEVIC